ncbi:MAG: cellulase family glycosylhydrolase [Ruminococcus sp.]
MSKHHFLKKLLPMSLTAAMMVGLTGCGGSENSTDGNTESAGTAEDTVTIEPVSGKTAAEIAGNMLVGWNLGNSLDAYSSAEGNETAWGNPEITPELIESVHDAGFSTIRIPVTYMKRIGDGPDYTIEEEWLARVQEVVDYAIADGMYVIINIHHDGNNDTPSWIDCTQADQSKIQEKFQKVWAQIADRFKEYDQHLIFESMNEIHDGSYQEPTGETGQMYYDNINALNQIFVDTIRASGGNNGDRCLLIPGFNTNIDYTIAGFVMPTDSTPDRIMVSVHYYDPYDFCLKESPRVYGWGALASNHTNWGDEDYVDAQFDKLVETYVSKEIPVVIGEYGCVNKNNTGYRRYYNEYVTKAAVDRGIVPVYWDNGYNGDYGFSLFDRTTGEVQHPEIVEAIIRGATGGDYEIEVCTD